MSFGLFRVKTVIYDQNRVHQVNTGQTMSTRVKNEFRAVSGQNRHFRPKLSSPGQYGSNHVDQGKKWVSGWFGSKPSFLTKTVISDQNRVHPVNTSQIMLTRVKNEFRAVLDQNRHFSTKTRFTGSIPIKCFFWYFIFCLRLKRAFSNTDLNF